MMGNVIAIVPAAGIGQRFGREGNKPFEILMGKPLVVWALEVLESVNKIAEIIPVLKSDYMEQGCRLIEKYRISKVRRVAPGGKERQNSVYNALKLISRTSDTILIHDGVRPLIEKDLVMRAIDEIEKAKRDGFDGVVAGVPVKDTIKKAKNGIVKRTLQRDTLWAIQTPQVFKYDAIMEAYKKAMAEGIYFTDDSSVVERYGGRVKVMMGAYTNIKITTPEDLNVAELFFKKKNRR